MAVIGLMVVSALFGITPNVLLSRLYGAQSQFVGTMLGGEEREESQAAHEEATAIAAGPRLALLIGVGAYSGDITALANPVRDAELLAGALDAVGFETEVLRNPPRSALRAALAQFSARLQEAGPAATGLIYFAGHGVQVNGVNYLVPRDGGVPEGLSPNLPTAMMEALLDDTFVKAQDFLSALGERPQGASLLILDACRDNPLTRTLGARTRSGMGAARGLAEMRAPTGMLIAYATGPGDVSFDGSGQNSPYAAALAAAILRPGQSTDTFSLVRTRVREATEGRQVPMELYRLERPFCFAGCAEANQVPAALTNASSSLPEVNDFLGRWGNEEFTCSGLPVRLSLLEPGVLGVSAGEAPPVGDRLVAAAAPDWLQSGTGANANFFRIDGGSLIWRVQSLENAASEMRLNRCR